MAKVRVTNVGTDAPMWESNTCGNGPAPLQALSRGGFEPGLQWDGHAAKFKTELMRAVGLEQRGASVIGRFIAADLIDRNVECPAYSAPQAFEPGHTEEETLAWDLVAYEGSVIPAGPAELSTTFETLDGPSVSTTAPITIEDASIPALTVVDYIDAALSVPEFVDWMELHPLTDRMDPGIVYWPNDEGKYPRMHPYEDVDFPVAEIGLFYPDNAELGLYRAVVMNRDTLEIVGVRVE